jgi:hypothetical protein
VKGSGRGEQQQQQQQPPLGEEGDFAVHTSVYGKVQAEPDVTSNDQEKRRGMKRALSLAQAGLSSYLCRLCTPCVHLSVLGVVSIPPQYLWLQDFQVRRFGSLQAALQDIFRW